MATNKSERPVYSAEDVRQGEIILRTRTRRIIFVAGLVGLVVLALVMQFA
ncbi:peptide ABC transporter permease [Mesorhizobium sp. BAC0120]|nr:peptide ABC transporter permease [Mesorhizobium sp. BAC0120]MDW6021179.1 peptide ABC transporter permease [Mesorhizobium sp. BAC0120]